MKKEDALEKFVTEMTMLLKSGKDFVLEQAPDIFRQMIALEFWLSAAGVALALALMVLAVCLIKGAIALEKKQPYCEGSMALGVLGGVVSIVSAIVLIDCAIDLITVTAAPKVFLIREFAGLVK